MVTIFTPVYNRAHVIEHLYQSLLKQSNLDFEWLIIDDGSEDEISGVIQGWIQEKSAVFEIRFYQQKNGGKHRAINRGVKLAKGEAFFIVDSDDYITEDAVEMICKWWKMVSNDSSFAGVSGCKGRKDGALIGDKPLFEVFVDATNIERKTYGLLGDKAEVYKTAVLKKYPFPEFEGENFLTEAVVWDQIASDGLKVRWFNKIIMVCEYRGDGLTSQGQKLFIENPMGWGLYIYQRCKFYPFSVSDRMDTYFEYYINLKDRINNQEFRKNLKIDEKTLSEIEQIYRHYIRETIDKAGKKIALYGVGNRGKKLLNIYKGSEVEVCYILDRKKVDLPYLQIDIDDEYPHVDAIIITPQVGKDEIVEFLRKRTTNKLIGYEEADKSVNRGIFYEYVKGRKGQSADCGCTSIQC